VPVHKRSLQAIFCRKQNNNSQVAGSPADAVTVDNAINIHLNCRPT